MSYNLQVSKQQLQHILKACEHLANSEPQTEVDEYDNNVSEYLIGCSKDTLEFPEDDTIHGFCL